MSDMLGFCDCLFGAAALYESGSGQAEGWENVGAFSVK